MNTNDEDAVGNDLISGGKGIAAFWRMSERKCRHLLATGQLPGAFQLGGLWYQSKSVAQEAVRERALASVKAAGAR
jgi:hypothetical protein